MFSNDGLNEVVPKKFENPTLLRFYASGFINNFLKHFQHQTQELGKCGELKFPDVGLFFCVGRGDKSFGEQQNEMKRKMKREKEELAKKKRIDELN